MKGYKKRFKRLQLTNYILIGVVFFNLLLGLSVSTIAYMYTAYDRAFLTCSKEAGENHGDSFGFDGVPSQDSDMNYLMSFNSCMTQHGFRSTTTNVFIMESEDGITR